MVKPAGIQCFLPSDNQIWLGFIFRCLLCFLFVVTQCTDIMFLFYLWRKTDANVLVTLRRLCKQWWNSQICPLWADQSRKDLTFWTIIELSFKICRWKCYDLGSKLTQNISTSSFVTIWTIYFLFCFFSNCTDMGQYSHFTVLWMKYHCAMTINIYLVLSHQIVLWQQLLSFRLERSRDFHKRQERDTARNSLVWKKFQRKWFRTWR